jgi:hypothetical protein
VLGAGGACGLKARLSSSSIIQKVVGENRLKISELQKPDWLANATQDFYESALMKKL